MRTRVRSAAPAAARPHVSPASARRPATGESALAEHELLVVNLDIPSLVEQLLTRAPELRQLEAELQVRAAAPPGRVERLEQGAKALREAHEVCSQLQAHSPSTSSVVEELAKLRNRLLRSASALVGAGALPAQTLQPHRRVHGQRALARSVCGLVSAFLAHWEQVREHTSIQTAELEHALLLARRYSSLQDHSSTGTPLAAALRERQRLFTVLLRDYAELRRAAQLLHGREQANRRVPSLYGKRSQRAAAAR